DEAGTGADDPGPFTAVLQVASTLDPSLVLDAADLWGAPATLVGRFGAHLEDQVLLALRRAARVWPPIARMLVETEPTQLALHDAEVEELLGPTAEHLAGAGLDVLWPAGLL